MQHMDMVCGGYFDCVAGNIILGLFFGGWVIAAILGIIFYNLLNLNSKFKTYSYAKKVSITLAIVLALIFVVVSVLYLMYGKGSSSTNLGF